MEAPAITVFMAVYNGEKFIKAAIESVLNQSFQDFELLIINDGSTDEGCNIIKSFSDHRIRLLENDANKGLFFTRNRGIEEAKGKYFAIQDCDDVAYLNRLKYQIDFLENNLNFAMCGSSVNIP